MRIDSHNHFWKYHPLKDAWITEDMKAIQQDFLPADLLPLLKKNNIDGCVAIQADQSEEETHFLLQLAQENEFIKGVVGWVDFSSKKIEERLDYFSQFEKLKGFRHIVQGEVADDFLLGTDFCNGIEKLAKYNFTYDILILPKHLPVAFEFVKKFPNQKFVLDHLAKPNFKQTDFTQWENGIINIATCPNVYCKVSGMVTEAEWKNWKKEDFTYCLDVVTTAFGVNRLLFGSDWPVSLQSATYEESCGIVTHYFSEFSTEDQRKLWEENAKFFYNL